MWQLLHFSNFLPTLLRHFEPIANRRNCFFLNLPRFPSISLLQTIFALFLIQISGRGKFLASGSAENYLRIVSFHLQLAVVHLPLAGPNF